MKPVKEIRPSVLMLMRGDMYVIDGVRFFAFGGASSHDVSDGILDGEDPDWKKKAKELDRIRAENYAKMKKSDWLYLADHCYSAMERSLIRPHYLRAAAKCKE